MGKPYPERLKGKGKERLIAATRELLGERIFDELTVEEIIKQAQLSRPAFYYHFSGGKEELRAEMTQRGVIREVATPEPRELILDAALRTFARSGISAATLDEIAAEAGVSRGTLCWHFHNKEELLKALIKHHGLHFKIRPLIAQVMEEVQSGQLRDEQVIFRRIAGIFFDAFNATTQSDLTRLAILVLYTHPEAAHVLAELILQGRKGISSYIHQQQLEGHFRTEIAPELLVQVIASFFAMRAIGRGLQEHLPLAQLSREETVEQLISLLLYGIVQRKQPAQET